MDTDLKKKVINCALFVVALFIVEMITFLFMYKTAFSTYPFLELLVYLILVSPTFFFKKNKFDVIYFSILMFIIVIMALANINFYLIFGDIFSLYYFTIVKNGGFGVFSFSFVNLASFITFIAFYILFVVALVMVYKYKRIAVPKEKISFTKRIKNNKKGLIIGTSLLVASIGIYSLSFSFIIKNEKVIDDEFTVDAVTISKNANFSKYGMFSYYVRELQYFNYNSDEEKVNKLKEYFKRPVDTKNEYTGLLEGYNVVTIMIETGAEIMVNETLTPNLYSMLNDGINFTQNVSKNKTNISEMIGITGSSSSSGIYDNIEYVIPFSIPNMLSKKYTSMYFHDTGGEGNQNKDLYKRKTLMPYFGFDECYFHEDMYPDKEIWGWDGSYTLDSLTMPIVANEIVKQKDHPFYAYYTSLSMHGPYYKSANENLLKEKYYDALSYAKANGLWDNPLSEYGNGNDDCMDLFMMAAMDFDRGLGEFINIFKQENVFDNTLFVIYGDHDIYYTGADGESLNYSMHPDYDDFAHYDMYKTVMGFYSPRLNEFFKKRGNTTFNQFTSPYNIVPTILDLLGCKYNANMYLGNSVFSPQFSDYEIFYSIELSSFFNNYYWTYDGNTIFEVFDDSKDQEQFLANVIKIKKKQARLDIVYNQNIFACYGFQDFNY